MKNKTIWILVVCALLAVVLAVILLNNGKKADAPAANASQVQESVSAETVPQDKAQSEANEAEAATEAQTAEGTVEEGAEAAAENEAEDQAQITDEETEDGVVITVPEGMAVGEL